MKNAALLWSVVLLAGGGSPPPDPIDPKAIRLVVAPSGRYSHEGKVLTREDLETLIPAQESTHTRYRQTPVLLDIPPGLKMAALRRPIEDLVQTGCVNIALRQDASAIQIPIITDLCGHLSVFDGKSMTLLVDRQETLEIVAKVGKEGAIRVTGVGNSREYSAFPAEAEGPAPDFKWKGPHPDYGIWSIHTLKEFLDRPEVVQQTPYVGLDIAWTDDVADVLRCLAALKEAAGSRVEPILKTR